MNDELNELAGDIGEEERGEYIDAMCEIEGHDWIDFVIIVDLEDDIDLEE